jgi:GxxExxY protein
MNESELNKLTEKVIGCAFSVSNFLGVGFLEKVYENALAHELRKAGLKVEQQKPIDVYYDGIIVGDYISDLLAEDYLLLELKTVERFNEIHLAQSLNYLGSVDIVS